MRISTIAALQDNVVFTLGMGQLYSALEALGIEFTNVVSPFKKALMVKEPLLENTKALLDDVHFVKAIKLLATPDLRLALKGYSPLEGTYASALYVKEGPGDFSALWTLRDANGHFTLITFKTLADWVTYFLFTKNYTTDYTPQAPLSTSFTPESLLLYFNALDCYAHGYYYAYLNYKAFDSTYMDQGDFFGLLDKGCQANDLRWLVPAAIHCSPWPLESPINFEAKHLESLMAAGLLSLTASSDSKEGQGLYYGADTLYMGLEFAAFRKDFLSLEATSLNGTSLAAILIATEENLHWFSWVSDGIQHSLLDTQRLAEILKTL